MAARSKQLSLIPKNQMVSIGTRAGAKAFGGDLSKGKRKVARPLATNRPIHLVLKSTRAKGQLSFLNHQSHLDRVLKSVSKKWGIVIRRTAWVGNHVHCIIEVGSRFQYRAWIRELTAGIVRTLSQRCRLRLNERGEMNRSSLLDSLADLKSFFDHRPWTRIIEWGKDYRQALDYLTLNQMEAFGLRPSKSYSQMKRFPMVT